MSADNWLEDVTPDECAQVALGLIMPKAVADQLVAEVQDRATTTSLKEPPLLIPPAYLFHIQMVERITAEAANTAVKGQRLSEDAFRTMMGGRMPGEGRLVAWWRRAGKWLRHPVLWWVLRLAILLFCMGVLYQGAATTPAPREYAEAMIVIATVYAAWRGWGWPALVMMVKAAATYRAVRAMRKAQEATPPAE